MSWIKSAISWLKLLWEAKDSGIPDYVAGGRAWKECEACSQAPDDIPLQYCSDCDRMICSDCRGVGVLCLECEVVNEG